MAENQSNTLKTSAAEVWHLKQIHYGPEGARKPFKIITQNFNGPCSFIAICNILILRGDIIIEPPERKTVSYNYLSQLVAEFLLVRSPEVDISDALTIMPHTQEGMDLNPVFTSPTAFRPAGGAGGELKLFEQVGIKLVHGWLVDPDSQEAKAIEKTPDYDSAAALIAEVDHLTNGRFVLNEHAEDQPVASSSSSTPANGTLSLEQQAKVADAIAVRDFLDHTQSQLTYHGLFQLAATLESGELVALFRNAHLSVLLKMPEQDGSSVALYSLVTDQVFLKEPSVVWERLEDVDGGSSSFVDSDFKRASPAGGDFAGQTAEDALRAMEIMQQQYQQMGDPNDHALARQLQAEEEYLARQEYEAQRRQEYLRQMSKQKKGEKPVKPEKKKSKDCAIM